MFFVCSDIHGRYDRYTALLEKIDLRPSDRLYVLGDSIDRGSDGCKVLLAMMRCPQVVPILGNHELYLALCLPWLMQEVTEQSIEELDDSRLAVLQEWIANGGGPTLRALRALSIEERQAILEYVREMELYAEVEVEAGRKFLLSHAGVDHFSPDKPLEDYELADFLFCRPDPAQTFWPDRYLIYGHTPTSLLRARMGLPLSDEILRCGRQIAIDCGCGFDGKLGCLCLDTMEEIYVE